MYIGKFSRHNVHLEDSYLASTEQHCFNVIKKFRGSVMGPELLQVIKLFISRLSPLGGHNSNSCIPVMCLLLPNPM